MNKVEQLPKHRKLVTGQLTLMLIVLVAFVACSCVFFSTTSAQRKRAAAPKPVLKGQAALGDWTTDAPGVRRRITLADLPPPFATESVDNGVGRAVERPAGAMPKVPAGFTVEVFADKLRQPRLIRTAPNGDLFTAESRAGRIRIMRDADGDGKPEINEAFAEGLSMPFGIAFYPLGPNPRYIYIGNTNAIVRFPYRNGDIKPRGPVEEIAQLPGGGELRGGGHWTRDLAFSLDGRRMFVGVGSLTNVDDDNDDNNEIRRARILQFTPEGKNERDFATGIRNPVGLAIHPTTGELWTSVNERDRLGDDLVPDYITRVKEGGFYGWPWYYTGPNQDPRHKDKHPELKDKVIVPDVLLQSHSASLQMTFYTGRQFPRRFHLGAFAGEHGSWNRARRTGYKVIHVPIVNGKPTGEYEDFMTGFVTPEGKVWGRPVGVTVGRDGSLFVTDDGSSTVWRITYGKSARNSVARR